MLHGYFSLTFFLDVNIAFSSHCCPFISLTEKVLTNIIFSIYYYYHCKHKQKLRHFSKEILSGVRPPFSQSNIHFFSNIKSLNYKTESKLNKIFSKNFVEKHKIIKYIIAKKSTLVAKQKNIKVKGVIKKLSNLNFWKLLLLLLLKVKRFNYKCM